MQSCDICRKRKVKCDRRTPCARCRRLRQPCTYTDILRKKGPKFVHSYPSLYLFGAAPYNNNTSTPTPTSSETLASASGSNEALPLLTGGLALDLDFDMGMGMGVGINMQGFTGGASEAMAGTGTTSELGDELELELDFGDASPVQQPQLQQDLEMGMGSEFGPPSEASSITGMERALSLYAVKLYPLFPVVDVRELRLGFRLGHGWNNGYSSGRYALLCSICAAVYAYLGFDSSSSRQELGHGHEHMCERYLRGALRARSQFDLSQSQSSRRERQNNDGRRRDKMLNSFFLFLTYWFLRRERHAWWYLRECISLLFSLRIHREDEYGKLEPRVAENMRIIFWAVFVVERYVLHCWFEDELTTT